MSGKKEFQYEISGNIYIQKPLVLGQIRQLFNLLEKILLPACIDAMGLIAVLGDKLPQVIAIVLTPDGIALKDKDIIALSKEIEFEISPEQVIQVIDDFFTCNPIQSLLGRIGGMVENLTRKIQEIGLNPSSASSPAEILQRGTASSGDSL
ncbi:MAG: hypothetical protein HZB80_11290 [Deltaproteobacteria bacterium]|nr:hypothetical protein [Deltaproteobacteria bacterium]